MWRQVLAGAALAVFAVTALAAGASGVLDVRVSVNLVPTSGACGAVATAAAIRVSCTRPGSLAATPDPAPPATRAARTVTDLAHLPTAVDGATPSRLATLLTGVLLGTDAMPPYAGRVEVTSWRTISLDNRSYVELTIAW